MTLVHIHNNVILYLWKRSLSTMVLPIRRPQSRIQTIERHMQKQFIWYRAFCQFRHIRKITNWAIVYIQKIKAFFLLSRGFTTASFYESGKQVIVTGSWFSIYSFPVTFYILQFAVILPSIGGKVKESIHLLHLAINPFYRSIVRC